MGGFYSWSSVPTIVAFWNTDFPEALLLGKNGGAHVSDPKAHNELEIRPNFSTQMAKLPSENLNI